MSIREFELSSLRLELTFFDLNYIKQVFIPNEKSRGVRFSVLEGSCSQETETDFKIHFNPF
jgi:hypothetical protein